MQINVKWKKMSIEKWALLKKPSDTFWIVKGYREIQRNKKIPFCETGYFENFDKLTDEEADHFLTYRNCYYKFGKPCERDVNGECDCVFEEEMGDCVIDSISNYKTLENLMYIRLNLLNSNQLKHHPLNDLLGS
jgi:hypothetical protein